MSMKSHRSRIKIIAACVATTVGLSTAIAYATDSSQLTNSTFQELVTDLSWTGTTLMTSDDTYTFTTDTYDFANGANSQWNRQVEAIGTTFVNNTESSYTWSAANNSWGSATSVSKAGETSDGLTFVSIDDLNGADTKAALSRLNKPNAKWTTSVPYDYSLNNGAPYSPNGTRFMISAGSPLFNTLRFSNPTTTVSNVSVETDSQSGVQTFHLTSTAFNSDEQLNLATDYTFTVQPSHLVTAAHSIVYPLNSSQVRGPKLHETMYSYATTGYNIAVPSIYPSNATSVGYTEFITMLNRVQAENSVKPTANSIASKAQQLAASATGSKKNVVTPTVIVAAARQVRATFAETTSGVKLTGTSGLTKGYVCVSAVNNRAIVDVC